MEEGEEEVGGVWMVAEVNVEEAQGSRVPTDEANPFAGGG